MKKTLLFLKPSLAKIILSLILLAFFYTVFYLLFAVCIFGDCAKPGGELASCCGPLKTNIGYVLYRWKFLFPVFAYLISCLLLNNRMVNGVNSNFL